ncbi:MAG: VCBS repeat-containing protein [Actinomycetes bacterium]
MMSSSPRRLAAVVGALVLLAAGGSTAASPASGATASAPPAPAAPVSPAAPTTPSFVLPNLSDPGASGPLSRAGESVVIADFDADGNPDTLVPSINRAGAVALLGDGTGGFEPQQTTPLPNAGGVVVADAAQVDGDGVIDVVAGTIDDNGGAIRVLLGDGDGTFTVGQRIGYAGDTVVAVELGDLNGDGDVDLAATIDGNAGGSIEVAMGTGSGTFGARTVYAPPFYISIDGLDLADVDADGALDLVYGKGCPSVRLNDGDGTFGNEICSTDPQGRLGGVAQAVADFDGDGLVDLATGDASGGHVTIALGDGAGKFVFERRYGGIGGQVISVIAGDVTGDGTLDLLASADAEFASRTRVATVLEGRGDGRFVQRGSYATGGDGMAVTDLDGDARLDLVSTGYDGESVSSTLNLGRARFRAPRVSTSDDEGALGTLVRTADVNEDGRADVVTALAGLVNVYLQRANGVLAEPGSFAGSGEILSLELADVTGDNNVDVVAGSFSPNNVFVLPGAGDGTFGAAKNSNNGSGAAVLGLGVGDVNGDGRPDVVSNTFATLSVLPGKADGTFGPPLLSGTGAGFQLATLVADVTGDGDLDAVAVIRTGTNDDASSDVVLNAGNGDGTFDAVQTRTVDTNVVAARVIADRSGAEPGVALVGVRGTHSGRTGLFFLRNVGGQLASPTYLGGPAGDLTVADVDGDRRPDVTTIGGQPGAGQRIAFFARTADGALVPNGGMGAGQSAFGIAAADLTGNRGVDLVEVDETNPQQLVVYENSTPRP